MKQSIKRIGTSPKYVMVRGVEYDPTAKTLSVSLEGGKKGIIPYDEISISSLKFSKHHPDIPIQVYQLLQRKFEAKIIKTLENGTVMLSKRAVQREYAGNMHIGKIIEGKIKDVSDIGLFVDIGQDIHAFLPVTRISKARIHNLDKWFYVGETIKVRVVEIYSEPEIRFTVSRKELYKGVYDRGEVVDVRVCQRHDSKSYYVEINPACVGIMDMNFCNRPLEEGTKVKARITRRREDGTYKLEMISV